MFHAYSNIFFFEKNGCESELWKYFEICHENKHYITYTIICMSMVYKMYRDICIHASWNSKSESSQYLGRLHCKTVTVTLAVTFVLFFIPLLFLLYRIPRVCLCIH